jgi:hypothetical protein
VAKDPVTAGFSLIAADSFDADGERPVSRTKPVWFRKGGRPPCADNACETGINRKFTPNQINRIFGKFSAI